MSRRHLHLTVAGILTVAFVFSARAAEEVRVALPAPSFVLKDLDGQVVRSTNFNDKAVIVFFWISTDEPCRKQLPVLMELQKDFGNKELAVVGIALDPAGVEVIKHFTEVQRLTFPILMADYKVIQDFGGLNAVPTLFVIDKNRNIIHKHVGLTDKVVLEDDLKAILKK